MDIERAKKRERMARMIEYMSHYWQTYDKQTGCLDYSDETFIHDALYAIGVAIDRKYTFANGYRDFKTHLMERLQAEEKANRQREQI